MSPSISSRTPARRLPALVLLVVLTALGLVIGAGVASAHVTVNPGTATTGSYTVLTFRVPNESAKAQTVAVTVQFPTDHPFASVSLRRQPGWTATVVRSRLAKPITDDDNLTITEAVSSITWKAAAGQGITLGEFAEFEVSVGPVPEVASLEFPTAQSYSDGTVVRWNQPTPAGGEEPDHPVPTLTVLPAGDDADGHSHGGTESTGAAGGTESPASTAGNGSSAAGTTAMVTSTAVAAGVVADVSQSDTAARVLGVIGIVVGAAGLLVAAVAVRRRGSSGS